MDSQILSAFSREVEKIAKSSESDKDLRKNIHRGLAGGILANMGFNGIAGQSVTNGRKMTKEELVEFARHHKEHIPDVKIVNKRPRGFHGPAYAPSLKLIYSPTSAHPAVLAHEMGHATGVGKHLQYYIHPAQTLYRAGPVAATVAAALGGQRPPPQLRLLPCRGGVQVDLKLCARSHKVGDDNVPQWEGGGGGRR